MVRQILLLIIALFCILTLPACERRREEETKVNVDGQGPGRSLEGIGGVSAGASSRLLMDYTEPYRSQILDYLFKPHYGASLQLLKVEIGSDVNSTDGSEPSHMRSRTDENYNRGYEWWLMEQAKARNPNIILGSLAWGAPGWIGNGHFYSLDMADYVVKFIEGARKAHALEINDTGIRNERKYDISYVKLLNKTLRAGGLTTRLVCCDLYPAQHQWTIIDDMQDDPALKAVVDVVGVHYPREKGHVTTPRSAIDTGKPLWSSEDGPWHGDWKGAEALAKIYNQNYLESRVTATEIWSPVTSYYDILPIPGSGLMYANTPWSGHYEVQPAIWVTAHTTQFSQPGWHYMDGACGYLAGQGSYVSLRSPTSGDYSVIIETIDAKERQRVSFYIAGGLSEAVAHVWRTSANSAFEHIGEVTPQNGSFRLTLDPDSVYSLTTTTGQGKVTATPPPAVPFPFPYTESFDTTDPSRSPLYFADQDGAFEVQSCTGRKGRCLDQVITRKPIPCGSLADPYTLLGSADWGDYSVSTDALLEEAGDVTLLGRIDATLDEGQKARFPAAYVLTVKQGGSWDLDSTSFKAPTLNLASGKVPFSRKNWHHLILKFQGPNISAFIDGVAVTQVRDGTHQRGMVGVGSGWNRVQFDNFAVR
jgi:hypothetical protein